MIVTALHAALQPVAFLLGTWRGEGEGEYPTIKPFRYREEVRFTHNGKPFLIYTQRTKAIDTGQPMHTESGYLRVVGEGRVEFVIAQPIGYAETATGRIGANRVDVECADVARTPTAKPVTFIGRSYWIEGDSLHAETSMGMEGVSPVRHLTVTFHRVAEAEEAG